MAATAPNLNNPTNAAPTTTANANQSQSHIETSASSSTLIPSHKRVYQACIPVRAFSSI